MTWFWSLLMCLPLSLPTRFSIIQLSLAWKAQIYICFWACFNDSVNTSSSRQRKVWLIKIFAFFWRYFWKLHSLLSQRSIHPLSSLQRGCRLTLFLHIRLICRYTHHTLKPVPLHVVQQHVCCAHTFTVIFLHQAKTLAIFDLSCYSTGMYWLSTCRSRYARNCKVDREKYPDCVLLLLTQDMLGDVPHTN